MAEQNQAQRPIRTHENVIFSCFGGFSNTGITSALASLEAVKELGLEKVAIGCLGGLPIESDSVMDKTRAAKRIITVDGCPVECARKIVEAAGFEVARSIVLSRDIGMQKTPLHQDINDAPQGVMAYISDDEVRRAKELIIESIIEG